MSADDTIVIFKFTVNNKNFYNTQRIHAAENIDNKNYINLYFKNLNSTKFTTNHEKAFYVAKKLNQIPAEYGIQTCEIKNERIEKYIHRLFF